MIDIKTKGNVICTVVQKKLTTEDYEQLIPELDRLLNENKKIRWYFEMEDFKGWDLDAFWEDAKFDIKHANDFEKIAMVGDKKWQEWLADLMKPFSSAEIKYFESTDKEKALSWIKSDM